MAYFYNRFRANKNNKLVNSPHYGTILKEYNEQFAANGGKVNGLQFFKDVILPLMPDYPLRSWYLILKRFKSAAGLEASRQIGKDITLPKVDPIEEQANLENALLNNARATTEGIQAALNVGMEALKKISDPDYFSTLKDKDKIDLLFKAMRAQDSRINAIARIKQDSREEVKFQKAFDSAAFGGEDDEPAE